MRFHGQNVRIEWHGIILNFVDVILAFY